MLRQKHGMRVVLMGVKDMLVHLNTSKPHIGVLIGLSSFPVSISTGVINSHAEEALRMCFNSIQSALSPAVGRDKRKGLICKCSSKYSSELLVYVQIISRYGSCNTNVLTHIHKGLWTETKTHIAWKL